MESYVCRREQLIPGILVQHFKSELTDKPYVYRIDRVAEHTSTGQQLVIYTDIQSLQTWARPLEEFLSEVDHEKYYRSSWVHRFKIISER